MRDETLKPCPFCGGKAALRMCWMEDGHKYRAVECVECGATTPGNYSEVGDQSAWDWNTRTPEQAIAATLGKQIIRCRDCKYYHDGTTNGRRYVEPHCLAIGELAYGALFEVDEDCFCSWAERKEVD